MLRKVTKNNVLNLMIYCIPLCPYKLLSIGDKGISLIYLIWGIIILFGLIDTKNLIRSIKRNSIALIAIIYFIVNSIILNNNNIGSISQFILLWMVWFFSYRRMSYQQFGHTISVFHKVMNIIAIYGIYEFFGRIIGLPLSDPWLEGHMIEGYNWFNAVSIAGLTVYRINGIFVEPSMFAQFLAVNILLYLFDVDDKSRKKTFEIVLNGVALIFTFSGTGILLLVAVIILMYLTKNGTRYYKEIFRKYKIWIILIALVAMGLSVSPVGNYMISRLSEFNPNNSESVSGYIRFVGQFNIANQILKTDPILGIGIGNVQEFIDIYRFTGSATAFASLACSMIVARYAAELGIIGLVILILAYKKMIRKNNMTNSIYKVFVISVIAMIPLSDTDINVAYWLLLYLLNFDFYEKPQTEG